MVVGPGDTETIAGLVGREPIAGLVGRELIVGLVDMGVIAGSADMGAIAGTIVGIAVVEALDTLGTYSSAVECGRKT